MSTEQEQRTAPADGYRVSDVAHRLGVTPRAVRARIARGTLPAYQVPGANGPEWRVRPSDAERAGSVSTHGIPADTPGPRELADALAALRAELGWLRTHAAEQQGHIQELAGMLRTEQGKTAALEARIMGMLPAPAGTDSPPGGQEPEHQPAGPVELRRRWWQFGRR